MPIHASDSNRLSRTSRVSSRRKSSVDGTGQSDANRSISSSFGDTLQNVDDLWQPNYAAVRTSSPSDSMFPRSVNKPLPKTGAKESVRSFNGSSLSQDNQWRPLPVPEVKASNEKSESSAASTPTARRIESREGTPSETSLELAESPTEITRRTRPARKPIPISKTASNSVAMGIKESKVDDPKSSRRSSVQRPLDSASSSSQRSTSVTSPAPISSLDITPAGPLSLRQEFELARPDLDVSPERRTDSARSTETLSIPGRSHSRGKSNTALHILHSFPSVPDGSNNNIDGFKEWSYSSAPSIPSPPPIHPHADPRDIPAVPPLTTAHSACYHSHRSMQLSRNIYAPVPCMTCYQDDQDLRWTCTWCCLRICRQCLGVLENSEGRALADVLSAVRKKGTNTAS
ncbi:MAG: hypothetical protein M1830_000529 [Pleopsidium flavum]|nr:MAG: hypothetical protein M1830_004544 [Pleopsidium flavum]KAI9878572.1 MAG: hypothetical protein M1830_000529 [Pleopsidium flavum]